MANYWKDIYSHSSKEFLHNIVTVTRQLICDITKNIKSSDFFGDKISFTDSFIGCPVSDGKVWVAISLIRGKGLYRYWQGIFLLCYVLYTLKYFEWFMSKKFCSIYLLPRSLSELLEFLFKNFNSSFISQYWYNIIVLFQFHTTINTFCIKGKLWNELHKIFCIDKN